MALWNNLKITRLKINNVEVTHDTGTLTIYNSGEAFGQFIIDTSWETGKIITKRSLFIFEDKIKEKKHIKKQLPVSDLQIEFIGGDSEEEKKITTNDNGNIATGAIIGAVVAGPLGALVGGALGSSTKSLPVKITIEQENLTALCYASSDFKDSWNSIISKEKANTDF